MPLHRQLGQSVRPNVDIDLTIVWSRRHGLKYSSHSLVVGRAPGQQSSRFQRFSEGFLGTFDCARRADSHRKELCIMAKSAQDRGHGTHPKADMIESADSQIVDIEVRCRDGLRMPSSCCFK